MTKKRRRPINLHVMVSEEEQALIRERMAEAGIRNMGAYMRKMALNGYVLHVRTFEKTVCYCGALILPGSGFAVPRLSLLRDTLSRGAESRRHPCCPSGTEV